MLNDASNSGDLITVTADTFDVLTAEGFTHTGFFIMNVTFETTISQDICITHVIFMLK